MSTGVEKGMKMQYDLTRISHLVAYLHIYWAAFPHMRLGQIMAAVEHEAGKDLYDVTDSEMHGIIERMWFEQLENGFDRKDVA